MPRTDSNGNDFGKMIKARRIYLDLTQEQVIYRINQNGIEFSQPFLSQIETGKFAMGSISLKKINALLRALGLTFQDLANEETG